MPKKRTRDLNAVSGEIRTIVLNQAYSSHTGHIGCALSVANIITALYFRCMKIPSIKDKNRDRFILSKGHAVFALHAALFLKGFMTKKTLQTFHTDGTYLGVHPESGLAGVELATGSLGQGLSVGAGTALAARLNKQRYTTYVLISDAECNEGSIWEAAAFSGHHKLSNLVALIDLNKQQGFGYTKDVLSFSPMKAKWESFGWKAVEITQEPNTLAKAILTKRHKTKPTVFIVNTTFGNGVSFMKSKIDWHYLPMSDAQYTKALADIQREHS